jgi:hypothetical protein
LLNIERREIGVGRRKKEGGVGEVEVFIPRVD